MSADGEPVGWIVAAFATGEIWEEPLGEPVSPEDFIASLVTCQDVSSIPTRQPGSSHE